MVSFAGFRGNIEEVEASRRRAKVTTIRRRILKCTNERSLENCLQPTPFIPEKWGEEKHVRKQLYANFHANFDANVKRQQNFKN